MNSSFISYLEDNSNNCYNHLIPIKDGYKYSRPFYYYVFIFQWKHGEIIHRYINLKYINISISYLENKLRVIEIKLYNQLHFRISFSNELIIEKIGSNNSYLYIDPNTLKTQKFFLDDYSFVDYSEDVPEFDFRNLIK